MTEAAQEGRLLWTPSPEIIERTHVDRFRRLLNDRHGLALASYEELWQWSVDQTEQFWAEIWDHFGLNEYSQYDRVLGSDSMPGAEWFPGARLNYSQYLLGRGEGEKVAIQHASESRELDAITWADLRRQVLRLARWMREEAGIEPGDRVVAYMPNIPETTVAMLACAAVGGIWSSCSPDLGAQSVLDRFTQIEPKLLLTVEGYRYNGKDFDRRSVVNQLQQALTGLNAIVGVPYLEGGDTAHFAFDVTQWSTIQQGEAPSLQTFDFAQVPFDHPLWILYSSGTTGMPKGIVHSQGGILLEHLKAMSFHLDLSSESTFFWYTTTSWMMWNYQIAGLLVGACIVQFDGNPGYPDNGSFWSLVERAGVTFAGTSAAFINALAKAGDRPGEQFDLSRLEALGVTGSPLSPEGFDWVYAAVKKDLWLTSASGGTDIASGFVGGVPCLPVYSGEIQARCLGVSVKAFSDEGEPLSNAVGELVVDKPMPSMPVFFWNDADGERYRSSYFEEYPGVWRHGDYIKITERGSCVIYGRSDSTLNRFGIRIGTAEIYRVVESLDEVADSLVVNLDLPAGRFYMPLFVVLNQGVTGDDVLIAKIRSEIKTRLSPRHLPDEIIFVEELPYTLTGKKMEVPVRKILMGAAVDKVSSPDAMRNPQAMALFQRFQQQVTGKLLAS